MEVLMCGFYAIWPKSQYKDNLNISKSLIIDEKYKGSCADVIINDGFGGWKIWRMRP